MREGVQDIRQHQFLVLLLVIETDFHQRRERGQRVLIGSLEEFHYRRVDVPAVAGAMGEVMESPAAPRRLLPHHLLGCEHREIGDLLAMVVP